MAAGAKTLEYAGSTAVEGISDIGYGFQGKSEEEQSSYNPLLTEVHGGNQDSYDEAAMNWFTLCFMGYAAAETGYGMVLWAQQAQNVMIARQQAAVTKGSAKVPYKENGGYDSQAVSLGDHGQKHAYDPSKPSTKNKSQYGKDVDIKALIDDTRKSPDSVDIKYDSNGNPYVKVYKKLYDGNISTSDTPTGEHRVFENLIDPDSSSNFPYIPRK